MFETGVKERGLEGERTSSQTIKETTNSVSRSFWKGMCSYAEERQI